MDGGICIRPEDLQVIHNNIICLILSHFCFIVFCRRDDIKNLEKNQWYTRVRMKAMGPVPSGYPTKRKLDSVIGDLLVDLKSKSNLWSEKTFAYGQKY